jgi:hypothetical protein
VSFISAWLTFGLIPILSAILMKGTYMVKTVTERALEMVRAPDEKYEVVRQVSRGVLKFKIHEPVYLRVESALRRAEEGFTTKRNENMAPGLCFEVFDFERKSPMLCFAPAVLAGELQKNYPNDTYVGRCFKIVEVERPAKVSYHLFDVKEIRDPDPKKLGERD